MYKTSCSKLLIYMNKVIPAPQISAVLQEERRKLEFKLDPRVRGDNRFVVLKRFFAQG